MMSDSGTIEVNSYRDIVAWQKAFALGKLIHQLSKRFPDDEKYGLTSQIRRSSISVASNIAEGYGRGTTSDYLRFLKIARGSLYEVDTQLLYALEFGYVEQGAFGSAKETLDEAERVLAGLIRAIERRLETT